MKIAQRVTDGFVFVMNGACMMALCCIVAVDIHEAMKARATGDRTREVGYWCAAAFQAIMAACFPIILLRCYLSRVAQKRETNAFLEQSHAAFMSQMNDMIRDAREVGVPDSDIAAMVAARKKLADDHHTLMKERA